MTSEILKLIEKQKPTEDIEELVLDEVVIDAFTPQEKKAIEALENLVTLTLNDCQLKSLENFPINSSLFRIDLQSNPFPADHLKYLAKLENLQTLYLTGCQIAKLEDLKSLKELKNLVQLDIQETQLSKEKDYFQKVFKFLPNLEILNDKDKEGNEVDFDEDYQGEDDNEDDEEEDYEDDDEDNGEGEDEDDGEDDDEDEDGSY